MGSKEEGRAPLTGKKLFSLFFVCKNIHTEKLKAVLLTNTVYLKEDP